MPAMLILSELATGRIVDVNECFERLSGWTLAEVRGRTLSELKAWGSVEDRQRLLTTMLDRGQTLDVEILMRTKSGGEIWLLAAADILEMNGSQLVLAQGVDITDRKRAEQALARSRQLLEDRVVERSERLRASQLELRRQRQLASIGTLAAGVAHQINNPIASIMASAAGTSATRRCDR
jgi:PAS domain S-box-containing protein